MKNKNADETESTDSKLTIEERGDSTVCGRGEAVTTDSALVESTVGFDSPEISVEGWYTNNQERSDVQYERQEVSLKFSQSGTVEGFTITTSLEPDSARDLADQLIAAAEIAEGGQ